MIPCAVFYFITFIVFLFGLYWILSVTVFIPLVLST